MIINIFPETSDKWSKDAFVDYGYFYNTGQSKAGLKVDVSEIKQNEPFAYCLLSQIRSDFYGYESIALLDKDNNIKEVAPPWGTTQLNPEDYPLPYIGKVWSLHNQMFTCPIDDTDAIQLVTKGIHDDEWKLVPGTLEANSSLGVKEGQHYTSKLEFVINDEDVQFGWSAYNAHFPAVQYPGDSHEILRETLFSGRVEFKNPEEHKNHMLLVSAADFEDIYGKGQNYFYSDLGEPIEISLILYDDHYKFTVDVIRDIDRIEKDITLNNAGELEELLKDIDSKLISRLKLNEPINAKDLWYIRDNFILLESLDLSNTHIEECDAVDDRFGSQTQGKAPADYMPACSLSLLHFLKELKLPSNLKGLHMSAMQSMPALRWIEIPESVEVIDINAFFDSENLEYVICHSKNPVYINDCVFSNTKCPANGTLFVPKGCKDSYLAYPVWKDFATIIEDDSPNPEDYSGISNLTDTQENVVYDLYGRIVKGDLAPGIYIKKTPFKTTKVIIK